MNDKTIARSDSLDNRRLESKADFYDLMTKIDSNEDLFVVKYRTTGDKFALRRTNLEPLDRMEFVANETRLTRLLKHANLLPFLVSFVNENELWTLTPFAEYGSVTRLARPS